MRTGRPPSHVPLVGRNRLYPKDLPPERWTGRRERSKETGFVEASPGTKRVTAMLARRHARHEETGRAWKNVEEGLLETAMERSGHLDRTWRPTMDPPLPRMTTALEDAEARRPPRLRYQPGLIYPSAQDILQGRQGPPRVSLVSEMRLRRGGLGLRKEAVHFTNVGFLDNFVSTGGRIRRRRATGLRGVTHHAVARAVKQARCMAFLPFVGSLPTMDERRRARRKALDDWLRLQDPATAATTLTTGHRPTRFRRAVGTTWERLYISKKEHKVLKAAERANAATKRAR